MAHSKWLLLLLLPLLFGFDTRNPFRTRGPFKAADFTIGGGSSAVEARCQELGTACLVSEPLNTDDYVCITGAENTVDFADSEGAGSKEATVGMGGSDSDPCATNAPIATSVSDVDLPTGTSQISFVMRAELDPVKTIDQTFLPLTNIKRYCMRHYRKFSSTPAFATFLTCGGDKGMELWSSSVTLFQFNEHGDPAHFFFNDLGAWSAGDGANKDILPDLELADCTNNWCRFELCLSTTDANIKELTNVSITAYGEQVGVGSPIVSSRGPIFLGNSSFGTLSETWPYVTYRHDVGNNETCESHDINTWGYSYYTHIMTSGWTTDSGQTIGAACEVEGGC